MPERFKRLALACSLLLGASVPMPGPMFAAQAPSSDNDTGLEVRKPAGQREPAQSAYPAPVDLPHPFWDKTNLTLFTATAAARALDYASTRHFRARGADEILLTNRIVDNKPLFIGIEAAGTAVSIAVSAWLHKAGHHRLERWVSITHIGVATFGDVRNYRLQGPQTSLTSRAGCPSAGRPKNSLDSKACVSIGLQTTVK